MTSAPPTNLSKLGITDSAMMMRRALHCTPPVVMMEVIVVLDKREVTWTSSETCINQMSVF